MDATVEALSRITLIFTLVLALSFVVERILELVKAAFDMLDSRFDLYKFWTRRAHRTRNYIERRLRVFQYVDETAAAGLLSRFSQQVLGPRDGHHGAVPVLSGDLVRVVWVRVGLKLLGCAIGIGFAFSFSLDLLALSKVAPTAAVPPATLVGQLLTGIAVGLGSGIVHKVIVTVERRQRRNSEVASA